MKYKLIVMDMDGTVLKSNHNVSRQSRNVLDRARAAGIRVTLASGRNFNNMLHIVKKLGIVEPIVSNDGALIKDPVTGEVLFEDYFQPDCLVKILEEIHRHGLTYTINFDYASVSNRSMNYLGFLQRMGLRAIAAGIYEKGVRVTKTHEEIVSDILDKKHKAYKVTTLNNDPEAHGMEETSRWIEEHWGDCAKISYSGLKNFDVLPVHVTKSHGLIVLQEHYGINREEIIAFGDSYNDLEMLRHAGFGVAMGNASDHVKNTADYVTKTNDSHGVAYAIEKFILNDLDMD
ncbi:HAD family phosphatase [Alkalibacter rhizosphaerae]|uniref:HAD family phosphatase n=1 Tax=Alkalibacter rhizosphaerae TaxID=2815577 RepID=A0A975AHN4_9FIRM|nr:Cof-type HAD-IIB family hydrolase [Alkalibacter rhizosphaerae]QSX08632.1 HAD family phosphatase [Alkalibacter rhizosphaerae]